MKNIKEIIEQKNNEIKQLFKGSLSVSKLCNEYIKEKFDDVGKALECAEKGKLDPTYKYAGMSAEEILAQWKAKSEKSKRYGRLLDDFADLYLNNETDKLKDWKLLHNFNNDIILQNICNGVVQFYDYIVKNTNYRFVARELPVYVTTPSGSKINGRFDLLLYDETTDAYIIIDWKTTENITTKNDYRHKLLGPAYLLDECDMNIYTIQLHVYKKALIETYKLAPADKISVYVCDLLKEIIDNKNYKLYKQNFIFNNDLLNTFIDFGNIQNDNLPF